MADPIPPRTLPTPTSRSERRRWQAIDDADARRQMTRRPNVPPYPDRDHDECRESKYQTHKFLPSLRLPRRLVCVFCGRYESECRREKAIPE